jgi:hypothetical protein
MVVADIAKVRISPARASAISAASACVHSSHTNWPRSQSDTVIANAEASHGAPKCGFLTVANLAQRAGQRRGHVGVIEASVQPRLQPAVVRLVERMHVPPRCIRRQS